MQNINGLVDGISLPESAFFKFHPRFYFFDNKMEIIRMGT